MTYLETSLSLRKPDQKLSGNMLEQEPHLSAIQIMYCDNDLFHNHIAEVQQHLQNLGHKVEVIVFENEAKIKDHFKNSTERSKLACTELLLDLTTAAILNSLAQDNNEPTYDYKSLDGFFKQIYTQAILGEQKWLKYKTAVERSANDMEAAQTVFQTIIERIIENKKIPDKISVVLKDIFEHSPFKDFPEISQYQETQLSTLMATLKENPALDVTTFLDHYPSFQPSADLLNNIEQLLTHWLTIAGIKPDTITLLPQLNEAKIQQLDQTNHWIISDRHLKRHQPNIQFQRAKWLQLPIESLFDSAVANNLLPEPKHLSQFIQQALEQTFAPSTTTT